MTIEANKDLVRRFYEERWNRGNLAAAEELVAQDYVRHDLRPGAAPPGPAGGQLDLSLSQPGVRLSLDAAVRAEEATINGRCGGAFFFGRVQPLELTLAGRTFPAEEAVGVQGHRHLQCHVVVAHASLQSHLVSVELSHLEPYPPCDDIDAQPMMDDRLGRGVECHGRLMDGAAGDGGLPREYHRRARN
jgi:hypothetical protein